jgi:hypothetical protein
MARRPRRSPRSRLEHVMLLAIGAVGGLVLGAVVAKRMGGTGRRRRQRGASGSSTPAAVEPVGLEELERRVCEAFDHDLELAHCAIDISAVPGDLVELTGWVSHDTLVRRATTIAKGVPGVRGIRSAVRVLSDDET